MKSFLIAGPGFVLILVLLLGVPGSLPGQSTPAQAPPRISWVSAQRIMAESNLGKSETARLQAAQQERVAALRPLQQALESTRAQLAKGGDPATLAKLQQQEQQQRMEFERATQQAQTDLQTLQRQMQTDMQAKVRPVVEEVAKARGVDVVLNGDSAVVWGLPGFDLTPAVIERLNAK